MSALSPQPYTGRVRVPVVTPVASGAPPAYAGGLQGPRCGDGPGGGTREFPKYWGPLFSETPTRSRTSE